MDIFFLTFRMVDIMLKTCYMKSIKDISNTYDEYFTVCRVKALREKGFRIIRLAYSNSYKEGKLNFDAEIVLNAMAEQSGIDTKQLYKMMRCYIEKGLSEPENKKYWQRIRCRKNVPTPIELLEFIYVKFDYKIDPL